MTKLPFKLEQGCLHVYTGDGKGKTTAALGVALRTLGAGGRVFVGQFLKKGEFSELAAMTPFCPAQLTWRQYGCGGFIRGAPSDQDRAAAQAGFQELCAVLKAGTHNLVILDEANAALTNKLIDLDALLAAIAARAPGTEVIITGRNANERLLAAADLVTEMRQLKHYYQAGVPARKGIEF
jgi:cob(I)alamin adenosyltransferase